MPHRHDDSGQRRRIRLVGLALALTFATVGGRSFQLQVPLHPALEKRAARQHQRQVELPTLRGPITDRHGEPLALSSEGVSLFADTKADPISAEQSRALARALGLKTETLAQQLGRQKPFQWIKRHVTPEELRAVQALGLKAIHIQHEHQRFYPGGPLAAQVLGFTGYDPKGLEGLERRLDAELSGAPLRLAIERDGKGEPLLGTPVAAEMASRGGHTVVLTLDRRLQYLAEQALNEGVTKARAVGGSAIVLDPATGEVLAMANAPGFDPNQPQKSRPEQRRNRAVTDTLEPGSTLKPLLLAAALAEKAVSAQTHIDCEQGAWRLTNRTIHDHHPHGVISVAEILKVSSNIGFAKIGQRLGAENMYRYLSAFGLGQRTGIDLPGEAAGRLRDWRKWYPVDQAAISFGQGVSVTPIGLASAIATLGNDGRRVTPHIVAQIRDREGHLLYAPQPAEPLQVVPADVARQVRRLMVAVTDEDGTGNLATIPGAQVAGKTGTAQKVDPDSGTYSSARIASFVGLVPAAAPRLAIVVIVDEPQGSVYGGVVAAPIFRAIAAQALPLLDVPAADCPPGEIRDLHSERCLPLAPLSLQIRRPAAEQTLQRGLQGVRKLLGAGEVVEP